jgi:hypothetical protein
MQRFSVVPADAAAPCRFVSKLQAVKRGRRADSVETHDLGCPVPFYLRPEKSIFERSFSGID